MPSLKSAMNDLLINQGIRDPREHKRSMSAYDAFAQEYPQLDAYGRKVASGGFLKENVTNFNNALNNAKSQAFEGQPDNGMGNILDYFAPAAMTAFHGSPHKFDKFSMDNIGTGEGAQAYGHGLYFAENPKVANEYQQRLGAARSIYGAKYEDEILNRVKSANKDGRYSEVGILKKMLEYGDPLKVKKNMTVENGYAESWVKKANEIADSLIDEFPETGGHMYEVDIPDEHVKNFLNWDKPLSEQSDSVKASVKNVIDSLPNEMKWMSDGINDNATGQGIYGTISDIAEELSGSGDNAEKLGSDYLKRLGIKGIKYLDGSSRTAGEGTRNLVVFDDSIIKMLSRNGESITPTADELLNKIEAGDIPNMLKKQSRFDIDPNFKSKPYMKDIDIFEMKIK